MRCLFWLIFAGLVLVPAAAAEAENEGRKESPTRHEKARDAPETSAKNSLDAAPRAEKIDDQERAAKRPPEDKKAKDSTAVREAATNARDDERTPKRPIGEKPTTDAALARDHHHDVTRAEGKGQPRNVPELDAGAPERLVAIVEAGVLESGASVPVPKAALLDAVLMERPGEEVSNAIDVSVAPDDDVPVSPEARPAGHVPQRAALRGGSASSPEPEPEIAWGRVGSLLNHTSAPSKESTFDGVAKVASSTAPWMIWGLGAVFGVGVGIGGATRLVRRREAAKVAPIVTEQDAAVESTRALTMTDLLNRVKSVPFDAQACFSLAVLMLQQGAEAEGLRYLDRCFHLDPLYVVRLLKDEEYAVVRQNTGVRQLLMKIKRDQDHRAWSGYA